MRLKNASLSKCSRRIVTDTRVYPRNNSLARRRHIKLNSHYVYFVNSILYSIRGVPADTGGAGETAPRERFKRSARINHRDANDDNKRRRRERKKRKRKLPFSICRSRNEHQCAFKLSADESVRSNPLRETKSALCTALTFDRVRKKTFNDNIKI